MGDLIIRGFHPADLGAIRLQPQQQAEHAGLDWQATGAALLTAGPCWTGEWRGPDDVQQVIGSAGFVLHWTGRATTWCALSADIPIRAWISIHRHVASRIGQLPALGVRRLEADSRVGWPQAARWLELLGFEREGVSRAYGTDGTDFIRWARLL